MMNAFSITNIDPAIWDPLYTAAFCQTKYIGSVRFHSIQYCLVEDGMRGICFVKMWRAVNRAPAAHPTRNNIVFI